jgi:hypothetical protein
LKRHVVLYGPGGTPGGFLRQGGGPGQATAHAACAFPCLWNSKDYTAFLLTLSLLIPQRFSTSTISISASASRKITEDWEKYFLGMATYFPEGDFEGKLGEPPSMGGGSPPDERG